MKLTKRQLKKLIFEISDLHEVGDSPVNDYMQAVELIYQAADLISKIDLGDYVENTGFGGTETLELEAAISKLISAARLRGGV